MSTNAKHLFKMVLVGDAGTGKTMIMNRYVNRKFSNLYQATIGADFLVKEILPASGKLITLQIWDTAGLEANTLSPSLTRGCDALIVVFNVTDRKSFESVQKHLEMADPNREMVRILVASKIDLEESRVVSQEEGLDFVFGHKHCDSYLEVSANANINIDTLFNTAVKSILTRLNNEAALPPALHPKLLLLLPKLENKKGKLDRQVNSCWIFPNKDLKREKSNGLGNLITALKSGTDPSTALTSVTDNYKDIRKGKTKKETAKLLSELQTISEEIGTQPTNPKK